ncbi:hypothetical protein P171DRAFT_431984 [Karstenula rhodostoma CBS 690.94]|uniref:Heterokaryon incompatibility domain-containing protein n=1 Tax=Karstenula rhodostoma CBS 690.94 TaxID=1392251 RepID=A0A9P4PLV8_9PLEO|nr:hypothetical protein P171DRAFT_431984 [Karstenula rhodostoma CBS 690.94]
MRSNASLRCCDTEESGGADDINDSSAHFGTNDNPNASEWLALVVDKTEKAHLEWVAEHGYTKWRELPVEVVRLPLVDLSTAAVLSWRWDTDEADHPSRNIVSAILVAKKMGFRYLFIDVISIDQRLTGDALLERVVEFSTLYRTIPVIAAYDRIGADFKTTIRRPWISSELQAYRRNPTRIIYASHNDQGAFRGRTWFYGGPDESKSNFAFPLVAQRVWTTNFATTIIMVLRGWITMASLSDLSRIMPAYAPALTAAYDKMSRNDYLLAAAMLAQTEPMVTDIVNDDSDMQNIYHPGEEKLTSFRFVKTVSTMKQDSWDIVIGDGEHEVIVGSWTSRHNFYFNDAYYCRLTVNDKTEHAICCMALGMTESEFESYLERKKALQTSLSRMEGEDEVFSKIEVVTVDLEQGRCYNDQDHSPVPPVAAVESLH